MLTQLRIAISLPDEDIHRGMHKNTITNQCSQPDGSSRGLQQLLEPWRHKPQSFFLALLISVFSYIPFKMLTFKRGF